VPLQDNESWFLLVIDLEQKCGLVLNPDMSHSVYYDTRDIFEEVCSCLTEMNVETSTWPLTFVRGLEKPVNQ
jgi:hypothetical protein